MKKSGAGFHAGELQATHGAKGIMADLRRLRKDPKHRSPIKFCAYGMFKKNAATVLACSVLIGACTPVTAGQGDKPQVVNDRRAGVQNSSHITHHSSLLHAISFVESGHNPAAIGDNGRATGQFQMHRAAREDASRASDKLQVTCDKPGVRTTHHSSLITSDAALASAYLNILSVRFQRRTGRLPTAGELYGCYNLGFTGFQRLDFDLRRVNKKTRKAAATVQRLCDSQVEVRP